MKLKLVINSNNEDYELFQTTLKTVAQLRKTAILRFTTDRLTVISTPKTVSSGVVLNGDQGQLWCTIPKDVFSLYVVTSIREKNTIAMECQCGSLVNVLKRYEKSDYGDLVIKLQSMPEWNGTETSVDLGRSDNNGTGNPICALNCTFNKYLGIGETSKAVSNSIRVGVRLLYKTQDAKIREPMVNYTKLIMFRLPRASSEYGNGFSDFIKRLDRYSTLNHIMLYGDREINGEFDGQLRLLVQELNWKLDIEWRGPLETIIHDGQQRQQKKPIKAQEVDPDNSNHNTDIIDSMEIENSELEPNQFSHSYNIEPCEPEVQNYQNKVFVRAKDWKVCSKLYDSFKEVVLAISHDESCVLHCSLDRETDNEQPTPSQKQKEKGQIIYYMARSKPL